MSYYFSMVVYADEDEHIERCLESILKISDGLSEMIPVKLIVADSVCSEKSKKVCEYYSEKIGEENFVYISRENMPIDEAFNESLKYIEGEYVNFSLSDSFLSPGALEQIYLLAEKLERPAHISLVPWTTNEKGEEVQYVMSPVITNQPFEKIDIISEPARLHLFFYAYFIRCDVMKSEGRAFKPGLHEDTVMEMLLTLLQENKQYFYVPKIKYYYTRQMEDNTSANLFQYQEWWYSQSLTDWILPFIYEYSEKNWPLRVPFRIAILYIIFSKYNCNYNERNKGVLSREQLNEFNQLAGMVFQYIDNELIFKKSEHQTFSIPRTLRLLFLKLKAEAVDKVCETVVHGSKLYLWIHKAGVHATEETLGLLDTGYEPQKESLDAIGKELAYDLSQYVIERNQKTLPVLRNAYPNNYINCLCAIEKEHVTLNVINYIGGKLEIDGSFSIGDILDNDKIELFIKKDNLEIPVSFSEIYGINKVFGKTYNNKFNFHVSISVSSIHDREEMNFISRVNDIERKVEIRSGSVYAHVRHDIKGQYWKMSDEWCLHIAKKNQLILTRLNDDVAANKEKEFINELKKRIKEGNVYAKKALELRLRYFEEYESFKNRHIWITFDKLYKGGDNGEYMFHYSLSHDDGIEMYYLIKEEAPDYSRLMGNEDVKEKVLTWGEEDSLLMALFAEAVLTTHTNIISYLGFDKEIIPYICDLFNPVNICIQHGLTTQDIAQFQNRLFDNLRLYLCASPNEIDNLSRPIYGYYDKGALQLTGVARYDALKSDDKKQVLITPSWRKNIVNSNIAHFKKGHNEYFKDSEYFKIYNRLINDTRFIEAAKSYGYKIVYLLHPAVSAQVDDFDKNDYVEIIPAAGDMSYEKILTESSLMITDYSGVQFDFAFQKKPILYYHPKEIPPHYEESEFYVYDRDGFGPIIEDHEVLVDTLCDYMKKKCVMKAKYKKRVDSFFAFHDDNNQARIYDCIKNFLEKQRQ